MKIIRDEHIGDCRLILAPLIAYIVGQGIADNGKERAKVEAEQSSNGK